MKDSYEQRIQNQFGAFCVKVLKNEARYIQRELASLQSQEKSLDELTTSELEQTAVWDKHFMSGAAAGGQAGCHPAVLLPGNDGP